MNLVTTFPESFILYERAELLSEDILEEFLSEIFILLSGLLESPKITEIPGIQVKPVFQPVFGKYL